MRDEGSGFLAWNRPETSEAGLDAVDARGGELLVKERSDFDRLLQCGDDRRSGGVAGQGGFRLAERNEKFNEVIEFLEGESGLETFGHKGDGAGFLFFE